MAGDQDEMSIDAVEFKNGLGVESQTASWVYSMWSQWDSSRDPWKSALKEVDTYLMATDTTTTTNNSSDFDHNVHRPKLTSIYDNLMANYKSSLIPNRQWVNWVGEDTDAVSKKNRMLLESYIRTKHRLSGFTNVVDQLLDDWIRSGNCFCGVEYVNEQHEDKRGKIMRGYKGPRIYRISPLDIVFNPFASSFENTAKIVRSTYTLGDLEKKAKQVINNEMYTEALNRIKEDRKFIMKSSGNGLQLKGPGTEEINKYMQATFDGFGPYLNYMTSGTVEIHEFYGDIYDADRDEFLPNRKVVIADRRYVLINEEIDTWNGKADIHHSAWRQRPENLWGQGPLDKLIGLQFRLDHLENMRSDAFDGAQDPDRVFVGNVETAYSATGSKEYTIADGNGDVKDLPFDTTILNADLQIESIEAAMEFFAGSPRESQGFRTPGEKTKFEVSQLANAAGRIFQHKLERFEVQILEPVINSEVDAARRASDYKDTIELIDPENGAKMFESITSDDLYLNGKYVPVGARHYSRQQQLAQDARDMMTVVITDPAMLQHFPAKRLAKMFEELMGFDEHDLVVPFGRMYEQIEQAQLQAAAEQQLQNEDLTDTQEPDDEDLGIGENNAASFEDPFEQTQGSV